MNKFSKKFSLGIDIGSSSIKIVGLKKRDSKFSLTHCGFLDFSSGDYRDEVLLNALREKLDGLSLRGQRVLTSVSGPSVNVRLIKLPKMPEKDFKSAALWEASDKIYFNLNDAVADVLSYGVETQGGVEKRKGLVVAVEKESIQKKVSFLSRAGVKIKGIKVDSLVLPSCLLGSQGEEAVAIVDIGAGFTKICVVVDDEVLFSRDITTAGKAISNAICEALDVDLPTAEVIKKRIKLLKEGIQINSFLPKEQEDLLKRMLTAVFEQLVEEIRVSLQFFQSQERAEVKKIILTGGTAMIKGMGEWFSSKLGTLTEMGNPFKRIEIDENLFDRDKLEYLAPRLTTALGLALNDLETAKGGGLNLYERLEKQGRKDRTILRVSSLVLLLILGVSLLNTRLNNELHRLQRSRLLLERMEERLNRVRQIRQEDKDTRRCLEVAIALRQTQPDWSELMREISLITPPGVWLRELMIGEGGLYSEDTSQPFLFFNRIILRGEAIDQLKVGLFLARLRASSLFSNPSLSRIVAIEGRGIFEFEIDGECRLNDR